MSEVLRVSSQSTKGAWQVVNQDAFCVQESPRFYAVADGDGLNGEKASLAVIKAASKASKRFPDTPYARLLGAFTAAYETMKTQSGSTGLCAITFDKKVGQAFIGSVGDSRCYWKHEGQLYRLTSDTPDMGSGRTFSPGVRAIVLSGDDTLVLMTRGVWRGISEKRLDRFFDSQMKARYLIAAAINLPGLSKENATAITIRRDPAWALSSSRRRDTR